MGKGREGFGPVPEYHLTQAVKKGNIVAITGQTPVDKDMNLVAPGDFVAQSNQVLINLKTWIEAAGGTMDDIILIYCALPEIRNLDTFLEIQAKHFKKPYPAIMLWYTNSCVQGAMIEVTALAVLD